MSEETGYEPPSAKRSKLADNANGDQVLELGEAGKAKEAIQVELDEGWLRELNAGVSAFINNQTSPFTCIFKHRFSDFMVNEIDESGEVLRLTTVKPVLQGAVEVAKEEKPTVEPVAEVVAIDWTAKQQAMTVHMEKEGGNGDEVALLIALGKKAEEVAQEAEGSESKKTKMKALLKDEVLMKCDGHTKGWRGEFHQLIREQFPNLRSETVTKDQASYMRIWYGKDKYDRRDEKKRQQVARYLKCVMKKENKDSTEAIHILTRFLGFKTGQIRFAGTKDKRGVTTQAVAMPYIEPARAAQLNGKLAQSNIKIGNFSASDDNLGLGALKGNLFHVILRNVVLSPNLLYPGKTTPESSSNARSPAIEASPEATIQALEAACKAFSETGFINYYGMQRFGTGSVRTHEVGIECLKGNWKQVVTYILKPRGGEREDATRARMHFETTGNAAETLKLLPKFMLNERLVLQGLADIKTDYKGAFHRLARPMRLMYPHAYQSYIWNMAASKRIEKYGYKVVVGDLVVSDVSSLVEKLDDETAQNQPFGDAPSATNDAKGEQKDASSTLQNDEQSAATADSSTSSTQGNNKQALNASVKVVESEEEAAQYSMLNVVLPLPGSRILFPTNEIGDYIKGLLLKDGLDTTFTSDKEFHLTGDYRPLIVKPSDFQFNILRYDEPDGDLQDTEEAALREEQGRADQKKLSVTPEGKLVALQLIFSLQASAYASMLVRELVKQPLDQSFLRDKFAAPLPKSSAPAAAAPEAAPSSSNSMDTSS